MFSLLSCNFPQVQQPFDFGKSPSVAGRSRAVLCGAQRVSLWISARVSLDLSKCIGGLQADEASGGRQLRCLQVSKDGVVSAGFVAAGTVLFFCGDKPVGQQQNPSRGISVQGGQRKLNLQWIAWEHITVHCYDPRKARVFEEFSFGRHPLSLLWMAEEENIMLIMYPGQAVTVCKGNWLLIKIE